MRHHCARPGDVSSGERSHKLSAFEVESFGRLGVEGNASIDQLAASVVGGQDGGPIARQGVGKERLLHIVSVTTLVGTSRRVSALSSGARITRKQGTRDGGVADPRLRRWDGGGRG